MLRITELINHAQNYYSVRSLRALVWIVDHLLKWDHLKDQTSSLSPLSVL